MCFRLCCRPDAMFFSRVLLNAVAAAGGAAKGRIGSHAQAPPAKRLGLAAVDSIIAISSAKGGVGKSTTAVNIAVALATSLRLRVGLLDADIHGPSLGKMMNLRGKPELSDAPGKQPLLCPRENYRVKVMSMSFFMDDEQPAVLRGPMVSNAFDKMLYGTDWGKLDVLVLDMPPGTGDAQLNLGQRVPLNGAVIVSTPQDVALMDVRRGVRAYQMLNVPVLGLVENMSYHMCKSCGHKEHTFGEQGVRRMAAELGMEVLGEVPLDISICAKSDAGAPVVASDASSPSAQAYIDIAQRLHAKLSAGAPSGASAGPKITVE